MKLSVSNSQSLSFYEISILTEACTAKIHTNTCSSFTVLPHVLHINTRNTAVICHISYPQTCCLFRMCTIFRISPFIFFMACDLSAGETCRLNCLILMRSEQVHVATPGAHYYILYLKYYYIFIQ